MALKLLEKRDFSQNVIDIRQEPIPFICLVPKAFSIPAAKPFVQTTEPIGIAVGYNKKGHLNAIALSLESKCMIIEGDFTAKKLDLKPLQSVLAREAGDLVGFDFGPLAMSIYDDIGGCRVVNAVDIQSAFPKVPQRDRLESIKSCLGDTYRVNDQNVLGIFKEQFYIPAEDKTARDDLVSRAWVAAFLARNDSGVFDRVERIDTLNRFDEKVLLNELERSCSAADIFKELGYDIKTCQGCSSSRCHETTGSQPYIHSGQRPSDRPTPGKLGILQGQNSWLAPSEFSTR